MRVCDSLGAGDGPRTRAPPSRLIPTTANLLPEIVFYIAQHLLANASGPSECNSVRTFIVLPLHQSLVFRRVGALEKILKALIGAAHVGGCVHLTALRLDGPNCNALGAPE